jgi:DNA-binding transcriptional regulator YiaG
MDNSQEVKKLRKLLVLDQQEFADVMDVDKGTISRWERGLQRPRAVHLRKMNKLRKGVTK